MTATVRCRRTVPAPPAQVWATLVRFGDLAAWAPNVDHSSLLRDGDVAPGLARRVQVGARTLLETVDVVDPERHLGYRIEGLPPALREVRNDWTLEPAGAGTAVTITTTVDAGVRPPQELAARAVALVLARASRSMLAGLARHLERQPTP